MYRQAVINAVREVDDALSNYTATQDQLRHLSKAIASSQEAVKLATERFQNGLTDFLNVLDAQRALDDLEDQFALSQQAVINQFIALYKALGGGWEGYETPPPPVPRPAILASVARLLNPSSTASGSRPIGRRTVKSVRFCPLPVATAPRLNSTCIHQCSTYSSTPAVMTDEVRQFR